MKNSKKDGKFFQTTKRGEIQELKDELHSADKVKQKDAVKKVIATMTVGKDVSSLFADVVNCIQTDNIELKKLVYLYVMNYAKNQPELAILAINTFRKDASDENPLVRSLAVRTMGCIRLDQVVEYLLEPLRKCCSDPDPYVRKTAAICIPKVFEINPELVEEQNFVEILKDMLGDSNPMVVANAVAGLAEISEVTRRDLVDLENKATAPKLLAALNECNEWGQVFILDALSAYVPTGSNDAESMTERITARLSHANPAVVLASIKVVLRCMDYIDSNEVVRTLAKKLNPPLLSLLSGFPEVQYVALRNIRLIVQKRAGLLSSDIKMFFCKYNDPVYVKMEKVDIMVMLVGEKNCEQVLHELKEYATGVDVDFVRKAVRAVGRVAVKLERACERSVSVLLELIDSKINYVVQEATVVIKDIFRMYPSRYEQVLQVLCENLEVLDEPEAKASMIWILGEYAERIDNVEALLEEFLENFHDEPSAVQMQLLTAVVKAFLKRPSTAQDMVSKVLKCATEESTNYDLRDRGYIYWRLLSTNPEQTKHVVLGDKPIIRDESHILDRDILSKMTADLSLMSSVYHKLPEEFVTRVVTVGRQGDRDDEYDDANSYEEEDDDDDRASRRREVKEEMARNHDGGRERGSENRSRKEDNALDLLDLGGGSPAGGVGDAGPSASVAVVKQEVLRPNQPGQGGNSGFGIAASLCRENGGIQLRLSLSNQSQTVLNGFALQVNKSTFGIAPARALAAPDIAPGASAEVTLPMQAGTLPNGQPAPNPLHLQMAMKNSLDVFYFNVPYELPVVLAEGPALTRDQFSALWQRVGETRQHVMDGSVQRSLTEEVIRERLALDNVHYIAKRTLEGGSLCIYVAATALGGQTLSGEITLRGSSVRVAVRTEAPELAPLLNTAIRKRLGIS